MGRAGRNRYVEIRDYLLAEIRAGRLAPGQRLPSERELCQRFRVSRMTVRHAVDALVWAGLLERRQGSGTYVAQPKIALGGQQLRSFTEDMRARGLRPGSRILALEVREAEPAVAEALELTGDRRVTVLGRLRLADDRPLAIEWVQVPLRVLPDLAERVRAAERAAPGAFSLYAVLEAAGFLLHRAAQTLEATTAGRREAALLQVAEGAPLLLQTRISYTAEGLPVEYVRSWYRGDVYRYELTLVRAPVAEAALAAGLGEGRRGR